jgi:hypothetical protein
MPGRELERLEWEGTSVTQKSSVSASEMYAPRRLLPVPTEERELRLSRVTLLTTLLFGGAPVIQARNLTDLLLSLGSSR